MSEQKYVIVETTSTFRIKYLFKVESLDTAQDTIISGGEDVKEFSQEWLGEKVVSTTHLTEEEAIAQYRKENTYVNFEFSPWSDEFILKNTVNE